MSYKMTGLCCPNYEKCFPLPLDIDKASIPVTVLLTHILELRANRLELEVVLNIIETPIVVNRSFFMSQIIFSISSFKMS